VAQAECGLFSVECHLEHCPIMSVPQQVTMGKASAGTQTARATCPFCNTQNEFVATLVTAGTVECAACSRQFQQRGPLGHHSSDFKGWWKQPCCCVGGVFLTYFTTCCGQLCSCTCTCCLFPPICAPMCYSQREGNKGHWEMEPCANQHGAAGGVTGFIYMADETTIKSVHESGMQCSENPDHKKSEKCLCCIPWRPRGYKNSKFSVSYSAPGVEIPPKYIGNNTKGYFSIYVWAPLLVFSVFLSLTC